MKIPIPHTLSIIFFLIIIMAILTWLMPAGTFDRQFDEKTGKNLIVAGTYKEVEPSPQGVQSVLKALFKGIVDSVEIIAYVLIVGGTYGVIIKTGAIDSGIKRLITKLKGKDKILIPVLICLFSIGGTTTGMWEETLAFYLIIIPLMLRAGYDVMVGLAIIVIGAGTGVMASTVNPFATGIASNIAQISLKDGFFLRIAFLVCSVIISMIYVSWYASKVKKDPSKSIIANLKDKHTAYFIQNTKVDTMDFNWQRKTILVTFALMILTMMFCIVKFEWGIGEISALFMGLGLLTAVIARINDTEFCEAFIEGAKNFLGAAMVIGLSRGIVVIAQDGLIIDTILNGTANFLAGLSKGSFIILNEIVQIGIAFLVPSSSGHASLTMSIMAPLADLFAVPRSAMVSSFQFASGLVNMITPTSGVLMAAIGMARIGWGSWVKFVYPLLGIQLILSMAFLLIKVYY
ncbi:YfcC family protein [Candidatus Hepatincolaceae symbiont of Richtersius coronifer]